MTLVALPGFSPSLYIVILYITLSPVFTSTGSFLCLYVAVVSVFKVVLSIFGSLVCSNSTSLIFNIYFLNAKSNVFCLFKISICIVLFSPISIFGCVVFSLV